MSPEPIKPDPAAERIVQPGSGEHRFLLLISLIGGLALLALALFALSGLAPTTPDLRRIEREVSVIDPKDLRPEPEERFLYVTGVLLLPFALGGAYLAMRRLLCSRGAGRRLLRFAPAGSWLITPLVLVPLFAAGLADDGKVVRMLTPGGAFSLAAAAALALAFTLNISGRARERQDRVLRWLLPALVALLLLGVLGFGLFGQEHFKNVPNFWASFNAVFYSVVQVFLGKELLVDFFNQYGLYPHFLEPIFSLVGLGVYRFTALVGLLNCLAFWCLYRFLVREAADRLLAFLGFAAVVFFGYVSGRVVSQDLYLQYHPLRLLFPALFLAAARAFAHDPTPRRGALLPALGAAALLWNPDTGTVVLASAFLLLAYDALLRRRPREIPGRWALGLAAAAAVVLVFSAYLRLRFGAFPDYARLFLHVKAFYLLGVAMLPMPRFGLWVLVVAVYALALLIAVAALLEGEDSPRARVHFFLSVLGLGLFSYYQGRSFLGNLAAAGYPAILIVVLLAADARQRLTARPAAADRLLVLTLLTLLSFSLPAIAAVAPAWVAMIAEKVRITRSGRQSEILRDAAFLRQFVQPGQELVIMSYNSGLYHLLTRTTNPLDIPGDSELVFKKDFDKQMAYALNRRGLFVIDETTITKSATDTFRRLNRVYYDNPHGTLLVFPLPRQPSQH